MFFILVVPIVFHMIFSNMFSKWSHSVSIMLPMCPQLSQMFFKWYSESYANVFLKFVCLFVIVCHVEISQNTTPLVAYLVLVCAPCLRHRCVCVREEKQIFFWFSHLPSFPSSFMFFLSTFLGMFYVPLCSQIIPNSTIFWQKISQMIFKNVLPCQVSISRERIYQCPLPLFTTVGYMTLTWEINPLRKN
jgi:hypothetical protein